MGAARMQKGDSLYPRHTQPRREVRRMESFWEQLPSAYRVWVPAQGELTSVGEMGLPFECDLN